MPGYLDYRQIKENVLLPKSFVTHYPDACIFFEQRQKEKVLRKFSFLLKKSIVHEMGSPTKKANFSLGSVFQEKCASWPLPNAALNV